MHFPERWGMLQFSTKPLNGEKILFQIPNGQELKNYLWLVYYKQKDYQNKHSTFASSLSELSIPEIVTTSSNNSAQLKLFASKFQFTAILTINEGLVLSVNENGLFRKIRK